jgi:hypothetical protein
VTLSTGVKVRTPLLMPSVSSAGFDETKITEGDNVLTVPEPWKWLLIAEAGITEALLVSAYDLHYGKLPDTDALRHRYPLSLYGRIRHLFIDSGLYEKVYGPPPYRGARRSWSEEMLRAQLDGIGRGCDNAVIINYDGYDRRGRLPFDQQIASARRFFRDRKRFGSDFLVKPERRGGRLDRDGISRLTPHMKDLHGFDIIGVTEKELGDSLLERLTHLALLRAALTREGIERPIHVFGALDPLFTPLYFAAGGEIFDGLTWMRYGYHLSMSVYREAVPLLQQMQSLDEPRDVRIATVMNANVRFLGALTQTMRDFAAKAADNRWDLYGPHVAGYLEAAHRAMLTNLADQEED